MWKGPPQINVAVNRMAPFGCPRRFDLLALPLWSAEGVTLLLSVLLAGEVYPHILNPSMDLGLKGGEWGLGQTSPKVSSGEIERSLMRCSC